MNFVFNLFDSGIVAEISKEHLVKLVVANFMVPVLTFLSFWLTKKFIDNRLNDQKTKGAFGYSLTFIPALIVAPTATFIFCVFLNAFFGAISVTQADFIPDGYWMFAMIITFAAVVIYVILVPNHPSHRLIELEDKMSVEIYRKSIRIMLISLVISAIASILKHFVTRMPSDIFFSVFCAVLVLGYIFFELVLVQKSISEMLQVPDEKYFCFATQLVMFINEKFVLLSSIVALLISIDDIFFEPRSYFLFFEIVSDVVAAVLLLLLLQTAMSNVLKRMQISLDKYKASKNMTLNNRQSNLLEIYNTFVLFVYLLLAYSIASECIAIIAKNPLYNKLMSTLLIVLVVTMIFKIYAELKRAFLLKSQKLSPVVHAKTKTFLPIISATFYVMVSLISISIIFSNWGFDVTIVLAAFSFMGAAIVLAIQDTVKSFIQGIILLMEENLFVGEYVKIGSLSGVIEKLSIRVMYLRNEDGSLHVIPYNKVETIINMSKDYTYHTDKLRVAKGEDVEKVVELLKETVNEMRQDEEYSKIIIGDVQVKGISPIDLTGLQIYWNLKTLPDNPDIKYEIYRRLITKFQKNGIKVPIAENFSLPLAVD